MYAICSDWIEFICTWENTFVLENNKHTNCRYTVERISVHNNINFKHLHRIYMNGIVVCEIFSATNNAKHAYNEVSVKVPNALLYTTDWIEYIRYVVRVLELDFKEMARWDIALDGQGLMKLDDLLNKHTRSRTIQINNDAIKLSPMHLNKRELKWSGWNIGKKKSGISARVYNKSNEILASKKGYIESFWENNGLINEQVGRFEVQLNGSRLKKYLIDLTNMELLTNAEYLGTVLRKEVQSWIRFYRVLRRDFMNHKKETAIKRGREIQFIKWNQLPNRIDLLEYHDHTPRASIINARTAISFNLREILKHPETSTTAQVDVVEHYAKEYQLEEYVQRKIRWLFGHDIESPYIEFLQRFVHTDIEPDETQNRF